MYIIIFLLCCIIVSLCFYIYKQNKKIISISKQINDILFHHNDFYIQKYKEGNLSILESDICKLVNKIYEQNHLLENEKTDSKRISGRYISSNENTFNSFKFNS